MTDDVDFRDLARSVELFVVGEGEQVMADKVAFENFYNIFSVGNEFQWYSTEP